MIKLGIRLSAQTLEPVEPVPQLAAGSLKRVFASVTADEAWDGLAITLTFRIVTELGAEIIKSAAVPTEGIVEVPHEVLVAGWLYIGAVGIGESGAIKLTTAVLRNPLRVSPAEAESTDPSGSVTPDAADALRFDVTQLQASVQLLKKSVSSRRHLLICKALRATFGGQTIESAEMPTVDGDVYEAVQLEVLGTDAAADGDIILGENGYFAVYGLEDGAATLTGTGTRLDWPSGGSGGALRVTVARAANGTFTADKTFAEIKAAYDAGSAVEAAYTDNKSQNRCILPLVYCTTDGCSFSAYLQTETEERELIQLSCSKTGGWGDSSGGIPAEDVQYQGNIGSAQTFNVSEALDGLAVGVPLDMSSDYAASGAASAAAWATMAKTGDATKYRVAAGRYQVYSAGAQYIDYITIIDSPGNTTRFVYITSCDISGPFVYLDVYSATSPGAAPVSQVYFSSEERFFSVYGKNVILPDYTSADNDKALTIKNGYPNWAAVPALPAVSAADNGKFLRVVSGAWAAQTLTNVAEVGA